jgi:hypothetical protein
VNFVDVSFQAWQKHSGHACSKISDQNPLGRNKRKPLSKSKKVCQKNKKRDRILRKINNGRKKGNWCSPLKIICKCSTVKGAGQIATKHT